MKYANLLSSYIDESGLTLEQIADKCKQLGVTIHPTYISKLRNGLRLSPTEEISRALAEACGKEPSQLVFAGYLEKTPSPIVEKFSAYEDLFSIVRQALLQLCNNEKTLETVSSKLGYKITFEQLCEMFQKLPTTDQLSFISSLNLDVYTKQSDESNLDVWLNFNSKTEKDNNDPLIPLNAIPLAGENIVELPVYGEVQAGVGGYAVQEYLGTEKWMVRNDNCTKCYMLKIKGDSMIPRFLPGDYAVVRPQNSVDSGDVAIVIVDDSEGIIKRVKKMKDGIILKSDNSLYDDREFYGQDCQRVKIVGKVIDIKVGRL